MASRKLGSLKSTDLVLITSVTLTTDVAGVLPVANGGNGSGSYTDGQLLIGNTSGNTLTKATLTAGSGITITNGNGSVTIAASGGSGSVATDTIWDAKGDLAVGTGADTAAKLAVGANGTVPTADSTQTTGLIYALPAIELPGGRLTLTTVTPILTSDVSSATTVYYTPHLGNNIPIYNGTNFINTAFAELSGALDSSSGHTGYHQSGKLFDFFVYNDSGTIRLGSGPAWTSGTSRGTGAGTTELELKNGIWTNKNSITLRFGSSSGNTTSVAANCATLAGTVEMSADGTTKFMLANTPTSAPQNMLVCNAYNLVQFNILVTDTTDTWTYTTNTIRQKRADANNQVNLVACLPGLHGVSLVDAAVSQNSSTDRTNSIGYDSTSAYATGVLNGYGPTLGVAIGHDAKLNHVPAIGHHYYTPLERSTAVGTSTWYGDGGVAYIQSGLTGKVWL